MHAPSVECRRLKELDPNLRFGWLGRPRRHEDDLNAGHFCVIRLRQPRHPSAVFQWRWETLPNRGPFFAADGTPFKHDWRGSLIPYLDQVIDDVVGWDAYDVIRGDFVSAQRRRRLSDAARQAAFRASIVDLADKQQEIFDSTVDRLSALTAQVDRGAQSESDATLTKEDARAALEANPKLKRILDQGGVNWRDYYLKMVGLE